MAEVWRLLFVGHRWLTSPANRADPPVFLLIDWPPRHRQPRITAASAAPDHGGDGPRWYNPSDDWKFVERIRRALLVLRGELSRGMSKTKIAESTLSNGSQKADLQGKSECIADFPKEKYAIVKESGTAIKWVSS